jgi:hypothetical protein
LTNESFGSEKSLALALFRLDYNCQDSAAVIMSNNLYDMYISQYNGLGDVQAPFTFQVAAPGSQPLTVPMSNIETPGINGK